MAIVVDLFMWQIVECCRLEYIERISCKTQCLLLSWKHIFMVEGVFRQIQNSDLHISCKLSVVVCLCQHVVWMLSVCCLSVVCNVSDCCWPIAFLFSVCCLSVIWLWPVCCSTIACILLTSCQLLSAFDPLAVWLLSVCCLFVVQLLRAWFLWVVCCCLPMAYKLFKCYQ